MNKILQKSGFTLLEIIIVIIIVGVLSSLALPRFFSLIEFSRAAEARVSIGAVRQAMERCYMMNGGSFFSCFDVAGPQWNILGLEDPGEAPNAHFIYVGIPEGGLGARRYLIQAIRTTRDGGKAGDMITLCQGLNASVWCGSGKFVGIGEAGCSVGGGSCWSN